MAVVFLQRCATGVRVTIVTLWPRGFRAGTSSRIRGTRTTGVGYADTLRTQFAVLRASHSDTGGGWRWSTNPAPVGGCRV